MARRTVLTSRQRSALFSLPQREADLLRHYTLSEEDLHNIGARRRPRNKLGFALQLCVLRYPGRLMTPGEFLAHVSPLGWKHINLTREYRWPSTGPTDHEKRLT